MGNLIFLITFLATFCMQSAYAEDVNLLKNPNFESRTAQWLKTGSSTFTIESASPLEGVYSANWDASATGEFFRSSTYTIPEGLKGRRCSIEMEYLWDSGTSGHILLNVDDGTNNLASYTIPPTSGGVSAKAAQLFDCPTSGTIRVELESTADAASFRLDRVHLGTGKTGFAKPQDIFSARISSAGVVSAENLDWINGNAVVSGTSLYTITFNTGVFGVAPNCVATAFNGVNSSLAQEFIAATTSGGQWYTSRSDTGAVQATEFRLVCQKVESSANRETITLETSGSSWSGYHDSTCSWARTNVAYGDPTADATCALVERQNSGFGTVSTDTVTNAMPGITFTPKHMGKYKIDVIVNDVLCGATGSEFALRLTDGTNVVAEVSWDCMSGGLYSNTYKVSGIYNVVSLSPVSLRLEAKSSSGAVTMHSTTYGTALEWTVYPISQQMPAPVFTELQNLVKAENGAMKIAAAKLTAGVCSVSPCTPLTGVEGITSITRSGAGTYAVNFDASYFADGTSIVCHYNDQTNVGLNGAFSAYSASAVTLITRNNGGTATDSGIGVLCIGK